MIGSYAGGRDYRRCRLIRKACDSYSAIGALAKRAFLRILRAQLQGSGEPSRHLRWKRISRRYSVKRRQEPLGANWISDSSETWDALILRTFGFRKGPAVMRRLFGNMGHYVLSVVAFGEEPPGLARGPKLTASYFEWAFAGNALIYLMVVCIYHLLWMGSIDSNRRRPFRHVEPLPRVVPGMGVYQIPSISLRNCMSMGGRASAKQLNGVISGFG